MKSYWIGWTRTQWCSCKNKKKKKNDRDIDTHGRIYKTEMRQMEYNASMSQGKPKLASHLQKLEEK